ncbi:MAG: nucleotidyltransferase domain-containing protein [Candidatus Sumerlaeota bacterium]|nr:nucleotidyltransferase domain-containing protein [Candidatus Sumerlaeota bacterium]
MKAGMIRAWQETDKSMIAGMAQCIAEVAAPERIILFGSRATGAATPDSDVDLLVIESEAFGLKHSRRKEMARLWEALRSYSIPKDILVYSAEEVEQWRHSSNHIIAQALREGVVIYERS